MKRHVMTAVVAGVVGIGIGAGAAQGRPNRVLPIEPISATPTTGLGWVDLTRLSDAPRTPEVATLTRQTVELRRGVGSAPHYVGVTR